MSERQRWPATPMQSPAGAGTGAPRAHAREGRSRRPQRDCAWTRGTERQPAVRGRALQTVWRARDRDSTAALSASLNLRRTKACLYALALEHDKVKSGRQGRVVVRLAHRAASTCTPWVHGRSRNCRVRPRGMRHTAVEAVSAGGARGARVKARSPAASRCRPREYQQRP